MTQDFSDFVDIRQQITLPASTEAVFRALTAHVNSWWTFPYRQAGADSTMSLKPVIGSELLEVGTSGHFVIWGRIDEICAPTALHLSGRFNMRGALAGRVHFDLESAPDRTCRLNLSHTAIGPIDPDLKRQYAVGWNELLNEKLRAHLTSAS